MPLQPPLRQVRAVFDDLSLVVYQAFPERIANAVLAAKAFVPPFKFDRMTWVKPSFLWMMYRSGWATKPDQERVLAVTITRDGFEWALAHSCLSHYDPGVFSSEAAWAERMDASPVRVQWDPERSLALDPLPHRAIQVGFSREAVYRYVDEWTVDVTDVTAMVRWIRRTVATGDLIAASRLLPVERPFPLSADLKAIIGATG